MVFITNEYLFLVSVFVISLSGVLMPGPLFAVTIQKAYKRKSAGALIAVGHAIIEFPLMFVIFFVLSQFKIPSVVQVVVGLVGGSMMVFMGVQTFRKRNKTEEALVSSNRDSVLAGIYTTAVNAGFILWWLTIGTTLILNAQLFGLIGFSLFAGVHWLSDLSFYTVIALAIFKSQQLWSQRWNQQVRMGITLFCVAVFIGFGVYFIGSSLWSILAQVI
jgi:threonine/homoserine/homoserine lactone efflux protein